jgi:tRNA-dihydrouridine synthase 1
VGVPVISNGNIVTYQDVMRCLEETEADAVMSAEWLRRNPALFAGSLRPQTLVAQKLKALYCLLTRMCCLGY